MSNIEEMLNKLSKIENQKRLFEPTELRSIIDSKPTNIFTNILKGKNMFITLGTMIIATLTSVLFFVENNSNENISEFEKMIALTESKNLNFDEKEQSEHTLRYPENAIPILHLTDEELENIGIIKDSDTYSVVSYRKLYNENEMKIAREHKYPNWDDLNSALYKKSVVNSDCNVDYSYIDYYDGIESSVKVNPIGIYTYLFSKENEVGIVSANGCGDLDISNPKAERKFVDEKEDFRTQLIKSRTHLSEKDYIVLEKNMDLFNRVVIINLKFDDPKSNSFIVYMPSKELFNLLPDRYKDILSLNNDIFRTYDKDLEKEGVEREKEQATIAGIAGIELTDKELENFGVFKNEAGYSLILNKEYDKSDFQKAVAFEPEEKYLKDFDEENFSLDDAKVLFDRMLTDYGYSPSQKGTYKVELKIALEKTENIRNLMKNSSKLKSVKITPLIYSDYHKYSEYNSKYKYWNISEVSYILPLNDIIDSQSNLDWDLNNDVISTSDKVMPLIINLGVQDSKDTSKINYRRVKLWYQVNEEFVAALPERFRTPLQRELKYIEQINKGETTYEEACKGLSMQENYLGICDNVSKSLEVENIIPNPITGNQFQVEVSGRKCKLSVELYSSDGIFIETLTSNKSIEGKSKLSLKLNTNINSGVYLLLFKTDKGDVISKRVVKI